MLKNKNEMLSTHFKQYMEFEKWVNQRIMSYLESNLHDQRSLDIFCHLIADIEAWLILLETQEVPENYECKPKWPLNECKNQLNSVMQRLSNLVRALGEDDIKSQITSFGHDGCKHENTVEEVLSHIMSHSQHHRGQLELLMEEYTNNYTNLGYMYYLRNIQSH